MPFKVIHRLSSFLHNAAQHEPFETQILPLDSVLFPGGRLHLRILEPRYIDMVSRCISDKKSFGICLNQNENKKEIQNIPANIGCLADVTSSELESSGSMNIQVAGKYRFRIEQSHARENGLIVANASAINQEAPLALPARHLACATTLRRMIERQGIERFESPLRFDDAVWVGYRLAELLPIKRSARQNMLEMNDSLARMEILHAFLTQQGLLF